MIAQSARDAEHARIRHAAEIPAFARMLSAIASARRRLPLASRADADELLDSGRLPPSAVEANLADLARLNRLPGGTLASLDALDRLVEPGGARTVLDVGTGAADMPIAFAARGWRAVAGDTNSEVLRIARAAAAGTGVEIVEADASALPFDDGAFDVVHCSLLLHHLDPRQAVAALAEMRRVARRGVVLNDLQRGVPSLLATAVGVAVLARSRVTRHDGLISARRAYSLAEQDALLAAAALAPIWRSSRWLPRVVTVAVAS